MPWQYSQSTGQLSRNGQNVGVGYAGAGFTAVTGRNNPEMQGVSNQWPLPQGNYLIGSAY